MIGTNSSNFQRHFGKFRRLARKEPVEITRHGRRELVLMSADRYDWLLAAIKRVHRTEDTPEVIVEAIRRAKVRPQRKPRNLKSPK